MKTGKWGLIALSGIALSGVVSVGPAGAAPVRVDHYPRHYRVIETNYPCFSFAPDLHGPGAYLSSTVVKARGGIAYPDDYCGPDGKTLRLMRSKRGLTFTVTFRYTYDATFTGTRTRYWVSYSDGSPGLDWGDRYRDASGKLCDSNGDPVVSDSVTSWVNDGYPVRLGVPQPWAYTGRVAAVGRYRTTIRLVK